MIYFVQGEQGGYVKIGYTADTGGVRRLAEHQTGSPVRLVLRALKPGGRDTEKDLHRRFWHVHQHGEWFLATREMEEVAGVKLLFEPSLGEEHEPLVEAIARRVIDLLQQEDVLTRQRHRIVDAIQLAEALGVRREWVYAHKTQLGGWPVGDGLRPRWRFELDRSLELFGGLGDPAAHPPEPPKARRRRPTQAPAAELLPIKPSTRRKKSP